MEEDADTRGSAYAGYGGLPSMGKGRWTEWGEEQYSGRARGLLMHYVPALPRPVAPLLRMPINADGIGFIYMYLP